MHPGCATFEQSHKIKYAHAMIRPLVRLTLSLIVILGIGMLVARAIGGTQPNPVAAWRTNPDGSSCGESCLFGITPGVTTIDEAIKLIETHSLTRVLGAPRKLGTDGSYIFLDNDSNSISVFYDYASPHLVNDVSVSWLAASLPLLPGGIGRFGDFVTFFGVPISVFVRAANDGDDYFSFKNGFSAHLRTFCESGPSRNLNNFQLFRPSDQNERSIISSVGWQGFANRRRYWQDAVSKYPNLYEDSYWCIP